MTVQGPHQWLSHNRLALNRLINTCCSNGDLLTYSKVGWSEKRRRSCFCLFSPGCCLQNVKVTGIYRWQRMFLQVKSAKRYHKQTPNLAHHGDAVESVCRWSSKMKHQCFCPSGGTTVTCPDRTRRSCSWLEMNRTPSWSESRCPNRETSSCRSWPMRRAKLEERGSPTLR